MTNFSKVPGAMCSACPLASQTRVSGRAAWVSGDSEKNDSHSDIVIIGEAPGTQEKLRGKCFIGPSGKLLQRVLDAYGAKSVWLTNAALCYAPTQDDKVKAAAAACCRPRLIQELREKTPKVVLSMGNIPTDSLLGKGSGITVRRGRIQTCRELEAPVLPTFHPAGILRRPDQFQDYAFDVRKALDIASGAYRKNLPPFAYKVVTTIGQAVEALRLAELSKYAVLDMETSGFSFVNNDILCMVVGTDSEIFVIPWPTLDSNVFIQALRDCKAKWVGHGSMFDRSFIKEKLHVDVNFAFDTLLAHYATDERQGTHDLKLLASYLFDAPDWEGDIKKYLPHPRTDSYSMLPLDVLYKYAAYDGYYTRLLCDHLVAELKEMPDQVRLINKLLVPGSNALSDVRNTGAKIDLEALGVAKVELEKQMKELTWEMQHRAQQLGVGATPGPIVRTTRKGVLKPFNPRSTQQVAVILYDKLKLKSAGGTRSTDFDNLERLRGQDEFVDSLLTYRKVSKLYSTYILGLEKRMTKRQRVHTSFMLFGTVTGRLSSRDPNLQNIPGVAAKTDLIRNMFIADPGYKLIEADFSQIELRMLAMYSQDPWLVQVFKDDKDLHNEAAAEIFGPDYTERQRFFAKTVNFGLPYGRSPASIANDVHIPGITKEAAIQFAEKYFARMPQAVRWIKETQQKAVHEGYVETPMGRRRRFSLITEETVAEVMRQAVNFCCQSAASDATLASLIRIWRELPEAVILLTVHDSILLQAKEGTAVEVAKRVQALMSNTARELYGDLIPYKVKVSIGERWGSLTIVK